MTTGENGISDERLAQKLHHAEVAEAAYRKSGMEPTATMWAEDVSLLRELTALRASHKRLVDVLEEIERHHLGLNRAKGRPANHSHTLRLCVAALAEARKLEGK